MHASQTADIGRVIDMLRRSRRALFITGAGISADSGLPTYRGIGGLYNRQSTEEGIPIEVALSGMMFEQRPALTWKYIRQIEETCRGAQHNAAHTAIAKVESFVETVCVLTQNVDGFHRAAGSTNIIDIHGDIHDLLCTKCDWQQTVADYADLDPLPRCPTCDAVVRPDVVLFGELLADRKVKQMNAELHAGFDVVLSIGTTSVFPYIARPIVEATRDGISTVEINPGTTDISELVDVRLAMRAAVACPAILEGLPEG